jgi:urea transport system substrate-binding protein
MALSERPVIDAVLLAVAEINARGGLLGRPVEPVLADGESDEAAFARQAEKLIREDHVCTIFGCWTSASRKAVVPVVERYDHLLVYPVQYEGLEQSPNVVYLGPVPNQQIVPALRWLVGFEGKRRWFLVGSDYVFPVTANAIIRDEARARGCDIVGEKYLLLGSTDVADVVRRVGEARPELIVNTINGDTNVAFFRSLRQARVTSKDTPTLSFSISEQELSALGPRAAAGDYVAASYFQSLDTPPNREFLHRFGERYGTERVVSSPMETAYTGVHLWAQAVQAAGRDDARAIREALGGQQYDSPQGPVQIDQESRHAVQFSRVGRVNEAGRLVEVYRSPQPVPPEPFPPARGREAWAAFLDSWHQRWGGRWSNPGP